MSPADPPPGRRPVRRAGPPPPPAVRRGGEPERIRPRVPPPAPGRSEPEPAARGAVATREPGVRRPPAAPAPRSRPRSRLRRFLTRWGWRAYAIPLLTLATVLTLVDLVVGPGPTTPTTTGTAASSAPPTTPANTPPAAAESPAPAEIDAAPTETVPPPPGSQGFVQQGAGTVSVVPGTSGVYGSGPLHRFVVEVEDGIGVDAAAFAGAVEATLSDPRSWGNGGRMSFQRVGVDEAAAGTYEFKVTLISPLNMETYCPGVGTGGYTSCRYGDRAVINLARWETAVPDYQGDVATYRQYVVNHEVGHALGNGHRSCPGPGQLAPVMQQQTLGLDGCAKNAWPYP